MLTKLLSKLRLGAERGRGNRVRKEVTYQEQLSEQDWLKAIGADADEDGEEDTSEDTQRKKKNSRKRLEAEEYVEESRKKRRNADAKILKKMKKLVEVVMQYQDSDGRILSEPFYKLPSRKELPDYYEVRVRLRFMILTVYSHRLSASQSILPRSSRGLKRINMKTSWG